MEKRIAEIWKENKDLSDIDILGNALQKSDKEARYIQARECYSWYYAVGMYLKPRKITSFGIGRGYSLLSLIKGSLQFNDKRDLQVYGREEEKSSSQDISIAIKNLTQIGLGRLQIEQTSLADVKLMELLPCEMDIVLIETEGLYEETLYQLELAKEAIHGQGKILVNKIDLVTSCGNAVSTFLHKCSRFKRAYVPTFKGMCILY